MTCHEIDLERQNVDAEIAVLEERIRVLRTKRNTLAPISALPNELLRKVLMECCGKWPRIDEDRTEWLVVTHVCHLWRTSALEYPQLWSSIDPDMGLNWMKTFLSRSKDAPLSLRVSQEWEEDFLDEELDVLSGILRKHQRLETVLIELRGDRLHGLLKGLTEQMPNLIRLSLHNHSSDGLDLPSPLLANLAPRLRILSLDNFEPPWGSPIMEGLASLYLLNTDDYCEIPPPSPETFFQTLGQMPSLQRLTIENILPEPNSYNPRITALSFPSLESIKLQGTCEQCSLVIRHIRIPHSAIITLGIFDVDETNLKELFEVLGPSWPGGPLSKTGSAPGLPHCDKISFSGDSLGLSLSIGPSTGLMLTVIGQQWTPSLHTILLDSIPLQSLKSLSIIQSSLKSAILKMTLPQLPSVTKLVIFGSPVSIFKVLLEDLATQELGGASEQSSPTIYLPQLSTLCIGHLRLIRDSDKDQKAYGLRLGALKRWLRFRRASGASIQLLEIADCSNVSSSTVTMLRGCIGPDGRVVWDGKARK
ncbi:hypothetical protein BKA70DRAFT_1191727 [Coprinopsis sp. MPI-PUGE-AT-0042]|nr:hypothetical protein BKA70DRAFT_1191727 [Coprinopsis sp. MPI-PUGE-AT-0042]